MSGSRVCFFSYGRTRACFRIAGKIPVCMDILHRRQMTGAMDVVSFMRSQEGMGSSGQDLAGVVLISFTISDTVTGSKRRSCVAGLGVMSGGVADAVDIRML